MSTPSTDAKAAAGEEHTTKVYEFFEGLEEETTTMLAEQVAWASALLDKLVTVGGNNAMKPGIFTACEGLAFFKAAKGGLGVTWAQGHGFVIRKLEQTNFGHMRWSAPSFFTVKQLGMGLAAGYESAESCLALMNQHSVSAFTKDNGKVGTDLFMCSTDAATSGLPAGTMGASSQMEVMGNSQSASYCYSLAQGALVNLSIKGTEVKPDFTLNKKLYGDTSEEAVLGESHTFREMLPLYRTIHKLAMQARV